jgi:deoxyribodipyrimidine photolyase-related protein
MHDRPGGHRSVVPTSAEPIPSDPTTARWLFGDQLGPHFLDGPDQPVVLVESRKVFARRRFHRQKAHLVLSAMRHRAAELGDRCTYLHEDRYADALATFGAPVSVCHPTSRAALALVQGMADVEVLPARGYASSAEDFAAWVGNRGRRRLLLEDFYRDGRRRLDILMDGDEPVGGQWNYDADNREPAPKSGSIGVEPPWWPTEDAIDEQVRADLDRWEADGDVTFVGVDGPRRFAATRDEALQALSHFLEHRLDAFGPYEDAVLADDPWMSHSLLSAPINLGLLDPVEIAQAAEAAHRAGDARLSAGATTSGTCTGSRTRTTATGTACTRRRRCRPGSPSSTGTPPTPVACPRFWATCVTTAGCTTYRG